MSRFRKAIIAVILLFSVAESAAQQDGFGLGVIIGEPTGLTLKNWISTQAAIDFSAAWSFEGKDSIILQGDLITHNYGAFDGLNIETGSLPLYYGIGGRLKLTDDRSSLAVRFPVGLNYQFENMTLDLFFEIVPLLELAPATEFEMDAAIGVRYFFGG